MNRFVSKRRLAYVVTYAAALASVATVPWALFSWRHVLLIWGTDFDWVARLLFVFLAVFTVGLIYLGIRHIEERGLYLFRDEAVTINISSLFLLPIVVVGSIYLSRHGFSIGLFAFILHGLTGMTVLLFLCTQLLKLHDLPSRPKQEDKRRARDDPFFVLCAVLFAPTLGLSATLAAVFFGLDKYGVVLPWAVGVGLTVLSVYVLRALLVKAPLPKPSSTPHAFRPALASMPPPAVAVSMPSRRLEEARTPKPPSRTPPLFPVER